MILEIIFNILKCIFIFLGICGWGYALNLIKIRINKFDIAESFLLGASILMFIGGWLIYLGLVSSILNNIIIYIGFILCLLYYKYFIKSAYYYLQVIKNINLWLLIIILIFFFAAIIPPFFTQISSFNDGDDFQGYILIPIKLLQTGTIQYDPFNSRLLNSTLGGYYFIQSIIMSFTSADYAFVLDICYSNIIFFLIILKFFNSRKKLIVPIILLFVYSVIPQIMNSSSSVFSLIFILYEIYLFFVIMDNEKFKFNYLIILCLLTAAATNSKSMYFPFIVIFSALALLYVFISKKYKFKNILKISLSIIILFIVLLLPYFIISYKNFGTFFAPYLGKGNTLTKYININYFNYTFTIFAKVTIKYLIKAVPLFLIGYIIIRDLRVNKKDKLLRLNLILLVSCFIAITVMVYYLQGAGYPRYYYPFYISTIIFSIYNILRLEKLKSNLTIFLLIIIYMTTNFGDYKSIRGILPIRNPYTLYSSIKNYKYENTLSYDMQKNTVNYRKPLDNIPKTEIILSYIDKPYLLNYKDKNIYNIDDILTGPYPGIGFNTDADYLKNYLKSQNIKYIYSTYNTKSYEMSNNYLENTVKTATVSLDVMTSKLIINFRKNLNELKNSNNVLYDDNEKALLELK